MANVVIPYVKTCRFQLTNEWMCAAFCIVHMHVTSYFNWCHWNRAGGMPLVFLVLRRGGSTNCTFFTLFCATGTGPRGNVTSGPLAIPGPAAGFGSAAGGDDVGPAGD
jgi:hypothetical protein